MTKQEWLAHYRTAGTHDYANCPQCKARKRTKRANANRRERDQVMRDCGLVKTPYGWE